MFIFLKTRKHNKTQLSEAFREFDNITLSILSAELDIISCNNGTQLVVKLLCQDCSRVKGQLMEGVEQEMPIPGTVWQWELCVTGCWNALCGVNVMMAFSSSVFILVCENWSGANVLFFAVVMFSNPTGVFCIVTSEVVNLSAQIKIMKNNRKLESSLIGAMVTTLA